MLVQARSDRRHGQYASPRGGELNGQGQAVKTAADAGDCRRVLRDEREARACRLRALDKERHGGNVSALISEMTTEAVRQAAFERAWRWYGGPEPTDADRTRLDHELDAGWAHARKHVSKKKRPRPAA